VTAALPPHAGQPVLRRGVPLEEARLAVIMVHGRNAGPTNILELASVLHHPRATYLAPGAHGGAWYPTSFLSPIAQNEPGITSGISVLHALTDEVVAAGVPAERIVLLGFSQGACLAGTAAQRRPMRYGGVVMFSGGLIGPPGSSWSAEGSLDGTPFFLGCSNIDFHIPEARVRESAAHFERMGADVTMRIYPDMGHLVNEDEVAFTLELFAAVAGGPG
jgi:phospholipase/carboxylesterase